MATPILFSKVDDFCRHKYKKLDKVECKLWIANPKAVYFQNKLKFRNHRSVANGVHRVAFKNILSITHKNFLNEEEI